MCKKILTSCLVASLLLSLSTRAQMPGGRGQSGGQNMNIGHFYGKIIEAANNKPLEDASVQLVQNKFDTVTKKRKDVIIAGMLTDKKGEFSLENLPVMGAYKLKITAIGFKPIEQKLNFNLNMSGAKNGDMSSLLNGVDKDLGNIKMEIDATQLANVTVTSSAPAMEMKIDRKVFNVEKNLNSVGGTAVDVMKNVPSVNVDIDGNVTLRNAAPQIFVDGRPTTMTLDQIPADAIASVEIITNPSAKFDASGGGAGILNIVLKKNRKAGYNGNVRAGIDYRGKPSLGGDFNVKQGKVNFFASTQLGVRKSISTVSTTQTAITDKGTGYSSQTNGPVSNGFFVFGRAGMDYFIDNRNTLSLGGNIVRGRFKSDDMININRDTVNIPVPVTDFGYQRSHTVFNFHNYGSSLSFKHNFAKANKEWTADANFNYSKNDNNADINSQYFYTPNNPKTDLLVQQTLGNGVSKFFTAQTDFVDPITDKKKIEMGLRTAFRDYSSLNSNIIVSPKPPPPFPSTTTTRYQFNDAVYAAYVTYSQQLKKFSYQLGLRAESSNYKGVLVDSGQHFSTNYPLSLFPSAFFTYKLTDKQDLQLNYSRKINRPNFFQLLPYYDNTDPLNISRGNPDLKPEFTTLIELAYQKQYAKSNTFLATAYFRNTNDLISRFQYKDTVNKTISPNGDSVFINSYINANTSYTYGLELIGKNKINNWWDLTENVNLFHATLKAGDITHGISNSQFSWFTKLNNNFKLPKNYSIQFSGDYQAKTILPPSSSGGGNKGFMGGGFGQTIVGSQGYTKATYGADLAIKKEFLKNNAASLTLAFSDIFRTRRYASHSESDIFVQDIERRRDPQMVRLNFNWRFGKFDVALFKRKNLKGEMENMQNAQQGMGQ